MIPRDKFANALFDGGGRPEIDIADEVIDVGIGCRDVAGLHRQQFLFRICLEINTEPDNVAQLGDEVPDRSRA
jgi:hypothetical protein